MALAMSEPLHLSFVVDVSETGAGFVLAQVTALVDGQPPCELMLDAEALLNAQDLETELDLYYDSKSSPSLIGGGDEVLLGAEGRHVQWHFPEQPYRSLLQEHLRQKDGPLVLTFERQQYLQALNELEVLLVQLEETRGIPVAIEPYSLDKPPALPLAQRLEEGRERARYWLELNERRQDLFGPLLDEELSAQPLHGVTLCLSLPVLADLIADHLSRNPPPAGEALVAGMNEEEAQLKVLREVVIPELQKDRAFAIHWARELPWSTVEGVCNPVKEPPWSDKGNWRDLPSEVLAHAWMVAPMVVRVSVEEDEH